MTFVAAKGTSVMDFLFDFILLSASLNEESQWTVRVRRAEWTEGDKPVLIMDVNSSERKSTKRARQKVILMDVVLQYPIVIHAEGKRSKTQITMLSASEDL